MAAITVSDARKNLFPLVKQVNDDHEPIEIVAKAGNAVLMSKADYDALMTTVYLLNPANAPELLASIAQAEDRQVAQHDLIDPDVSVYDGFAPRIQT